MEKYLKYFEKGIIVILLLLMMIAVSLITIELAYSMALEIIKPPVMLLEAVEVQNFFGFFFMALIGLELIETMKAYLHDNKLHVEIVFLVAMIAVARKIIIINYADTSALMLFGIAALLISLSLGYYFMKKGFLSFSKI